MYLGKNKSLSFGSHAVVHSSLISKFISSNDALSLDDVGDAGIRVKRDIRVVVVIPLIANGDALPDGPDQVNEQNSEKELKHSKGKALAFAVLGIAVRSVHGATAGEDDVQDEHLNSFFASQQGNRTSTVPLVFGHTVGVRINVGQIFGVDVGPVGIF
jgi:hypothetical protein